MEQADLEKHERQLALKKLIRFHKGGLSTHRFVMNPSTVYLEEQTVKKLEELYDLTCKQ